MKKIGAFGAGQFSLGTLVEGRPGTTIFQNPGGGGGWGGGGGHIQGPGPAAPPPHGVPMVNMGAASYHLYEWFALVC